MLDRLARPIHTALRRASYRKNLGKKNCELGPEDIVRICRTFLGFRETEESRILGNEAFGYWKVTVERPLRLKVDLSEGRRQRPVEHPRWESSHLCLGSVDPDCESARPGRVLPGRRHPLG